MKTAQKIKMNVVTNVKSEWKRLRQNPAQVLRVAIPVLMLALVFMGAVPSFAQTEPPTLELDTDQMITGLFEGANIIIAALGAVMFLLAGFKLGGILIRGIVDAIGGIRF
ncbi:MAG: hypothetical protein GY803_30785 [Chloroflexi bacterium]|nr:hypothetical protein [Chloroflexota bacterium]